MILADSAYVRIGETLPKTMGLCPSYLPLAPPSPHDEDVRRGFRGPNIILYKYFQELNTIAIDQYTNLSHSATQIKDSLHDLDVKYKLLLPYLEQLNQLGKFLELKFY